MFGLQQRSTIVLFSLAGLSAPTTVPQPSLHVDWYLFPVFSHLIAIFGLLTDSFPTTRWAIFPWRTSRRKYHRRTSRQLWRHYWRWVLEFSGGTSSRGSPDYSKSQHIKSVRLYSRALNATFLCMGHCRGAHTFALVYSVLYFVRGELCSGHARPQQLNVIPNAWQVNVIAESWYGTAEQRACLLLQRYWMSASASVGAVFLLKRSRAKNVRFSAACMCAAASISVLHASLPTLAHFPVFCEMPACYWFGVLLPFPNSGTIIELLLSFAFR